MEELKVGQSTTVKIGDKEILIRPLPLGKIKKAMMVFTSDNLGPFDMVKQYLAVALDLDEAWIEANLTFPDCEMLIDSIRKVNGINDFFKKGPAATTEKDLSEKSQILPTPSA